MDMIHPLLEKDKQDQARKYEKEKRLIGLFDSLISLIVILLFYFSGLSKYLANLLPESSVIWTFCIYVFSFILITFLIGLPIGYYSGYVREHYWGFSNQTVKSWLWDQLKSLMVGLVISLILLGLLFLIMSLWPQNWWLIAAIAVAFVSVIFATIFPVVIMPLFNKYSPIETGELTERLSSLLKRTGLKASGFFMEDMSKQTKKENAFLGGLGRTRRVVLGDNLINNMSTAEIESVIAHEVGHYKFRHIWKNVAFGTIQQLIVFYLLHRLMIAIFPEFLSDFRWNLTLFPIFALLMSIISGFLFGPLGNAISRRFEQQADQTALELIDDKNAFLTAMAGLANRNLSNAYPSNWIKLLYYSHPPIGERLEMAEKWAD